MLTSYTDDEALFEAIMAGAAGYVLKQIRGNDLIDAIQTVADGKSLLDPAATARLHGAASGHGRHPTSGWPRSPTRSASCSTCWPRA